MSFWNILKIGSSGLAAQRLRLDVIANNIANVETTRTAEGGAYKRKDVVFQSEGTKTAFGPIFSTFSRSKMGRVNQQAGGVKVAEIITGEEEGPKVYDPNHPDANEEGYVELPNVNIVAEMTNMLSATRSYEASLTVIEAAKSMVARALEIGR